MIELSEARTVWLHFGTETEESGLLFLIFLRVSASLGNNITVYFFEETKMRTKYVT